MNWIDTAAVYGLGHSEEVVGRAVRDRPEAHRPYVFTECGLAWDEPDRIDLYQVHWPPEDGAGVEEYWSALLELKAEGTVCSVPEESPAVVR